MNDPINLPADLAAKALREASERGMSLTDFVRTALERVVSCDPATDPLFTDSAVYDGDAPSNLASDHDEYLYGDAS